MTPEAELLLKAAINIIAALILTYAIFYRRYKNKELFASAMILNICIFAVMSIITDGDIGLQAGLGLFAILSILRFRSENFEKMEMAYFFGAVAIGAVNGIATLGPTLLFMNLLILAVIFIIDGEFLLRREEEMKICLDTIPPHLLDEERTKDELGTKFGIRVVRFEIRELDYVKDTAVLKVHFNRLQKQGGAAAIVKQPAGARHG